MLGQPFRSPLLRADLPVYPHLLQLIRVTGGTIPGPQAGSSSNAHPTANVLYLAYTQQLKPDTIAPRDREPCLVVDVTGLGLTAGYCHCRLASSYNGLPVYEVVPVSSIPSSSGHSGQFLTTDGTTPYWTSLGTTVTFSGCRLICTSVPAITTFTNIYLDNFGEDFDTDGYHSGVSNTTRITFPFTGYYSFGARVNWNFSNGAKQLSIQRGPAPGSNSIMAYSLVTPASPYYTTQDALGIGHFGAGEYIEAYVYTEVASSLQAYGTGTADLNCQFWAHLIGT